MIEREVENGPAAADCKTQEEATKDMRWHAGLIGPTESAGLVAESVLPPDEGL